MQGLLRHRKNLITASILCVAILSMANIQFVGAGSWSEYENRLTTHIYFDGLPTITQTNDGNIWILWQKEYFDNDSIAYIVSSDMGKSWSSVEFLATIGQNTHPSMRQAENGTLWLFWASDRTGNYEIFYKTSSDLGSTWCEDTQLTNSPFDDLSPSIVTTTDGAVWLFWGRNRIGNYEIFYKIYNGTAWSNDTQLLSEPAVDKTPSVTKTRDGEIWVAWASLRYENYEILYKIYNGTDWSDNKRLTYNSNIDTVPSLLETKNGTIWIFWASSPATQSGTDDIYYKYTNDNGATWSDAVQFTTDKYDDTWPAIYQTSDTRIWVLWASDRVDQPDYGNFDVWYRISLVGDVNNDGVVDIFDLSEVTWAFGTQPGDPNWNPDADINVDGKVDLDDLILVGRDYGST